MTRSEIERVEAAWRALSPHPSPRAKAAADAIVLFLDELSDDGVIDRLSEGRSARALIAGMMASLSRKSRKCALP